MPSDEAYEAVLAELGKLHEAWRFHRESINRAVALLADEVFRFEKRLDTDDAARVTRQAEIDSKLDSIAHGLASIRQWRWIRIGIEVAVILIVVAFVIGASR